MSEKTQLHIPGFKPIGSNSDITYMVLLCLPIGPPSIKSIKFEFRCSAFMAFGN